ncbi:Mur ligase [Lactifluus volemus]|nr:Mur ligase [Lactifluus volemus]
MHRVRLSLRLPIHIAHWIFDHKLFPTAQRRKMSGRSYKDAINLLNTLQSNAAALEAAKRSNALGISQMVEYLERIGYKQEDLNTLNVLHVTGTKGKGSTCAFIDSIIRHAKPGWNIGLYTSPHLVAVRERILVRKFFFDVWDRLEENSHETPLTGKSKPAYFRYTTLMAFHAFLTLKVDATILEVGVGGAYDSTNIVPRPIVTGISSLGIDHVGVLGKTVGEIAWQKGGIFKEGVPAITVNQPREGMEVLKQRSVDLKASEFIIVPPVPEISEAQLGLAGQHQISNAGLAVLLSQKFLELKESASPEKNISDTFLQGLKAAKWPGRCQTVSDPKHPQTVWFLDGAHTVESLDCCIEWFASPSAALKTKPAESMFIFNRENTSRILIFNCTNGRSGTSFLETVLTKIEAQIRLHGSGETSHTFFDKVVFCANVTYADGHFKGDLTAVSILEDDLTQLKTQHELAAAWRSLVRTFPEENVHLHLVGGLIEVAGLSDVAL